MFINAIGAYYEEILSGWTFGSQTDQLTVLGDLQIEASTTPGFEYTFPDKTGIVALTSDFNYLTGATFNTGTGDLDLGMLTGNTITVDLDGRYLLESIFNSYTGSTTGTDDYVTSAAFNTSNGVLTLTRISGGTVTQDLDGRYIENSGGTANQVVVYNTANSADGTTNFTFDSSTTLLGIGINNSDAALLSLYGDGTASTTGGNLRLYMAADHDTTIDYYIIQGSSDDLLIGPNTDSDALKYDGATNEWVSSVDVNIYQPVNDGNPTFDIGSSATETLEIEAQYATGTQTLQYVDFTSKTASGTADYGQFRFYVDEVLRLTINDTSINTQGTIVSSGSGGSTTMNQNQFTLSESLGGLNAIIGEDDGFSTTLQFAATSSDETITIPNATGTMALISDVNAPFYFATGASNTYKVSFANTTGNASGNFESLIDSSSNFTYNPSTNTIASVNLGQSAIPYHVATATNGNFKVTFSSTIGTTGGNFQHQFDSGSGEFTYNPSTNILSTPNLILSSVPTTDAGFSTSRLLTRDTSGNVDAIVASGGGTANFLRADGTWAPAGGGGGSGDVVTGMTFTTTNGILELRTLSGTSITEDLDGRYAYITGTTANVALIYNNPVESTAILPLSGGSTSTGIYSTVAGGSTNDTSGDYSFIGGGISHSIVGDYTTIVGGFDHVSTGAAYAFIGGGQTNSILASWGTITGGLSNSITSSRTYSTIGGGQDNIISGGTHGTIGGGDDNIVSGTHGFVGGGARNIASGNYSTIGGGDENTSSSYQSTVSGGYQNTASAINAFIGGGWLNSVAAREAAIGGGSGNTITISRDYGFIGAGLGNQITGSTHGVIAGGQTNNLNGFASFIGAGLSNQLLGNQGVIAGGNTNYIASGRAYAFIGAGLGNQITAGTYGFIGGGQTNIVSGTNAFVGGGRNNTASNFYATVAGGNTNVASNLYSTVAGGRNNTSSNNYSTVAGGRNNLASAIYSGILGGSGNTVSHSSSFAIGSNLTSVSANTTFTENIITNGDIKVTNGKIGVNIDPFYDLHINSTNGAFTALFNQTGSTSTYNVLIFDHDNGLARGMIGVGGSAAGDPEFEDAMGVGTFNAYPTYLATNDLPRVRVDGTTGNVNIGGSNVDDGYKLTVSGTSRFTGNVHIGTGFNTSYDLNIGTNGLGIEYSRGIEFTGISILGSRINASTGNDLLFSTRATGTPYTLTENMRINNFTGNVSIGNTNDTYKLDVSGDVSFESGLITTNPSFLGSNITTMLLKGGSGDNTRSGGIRIQSNNATLDGATYFLSSKMRFGTVSSHDVEIIRGNSVISTIINAGIQLADGKQILATDSGGTDRSILWVDSATQVLNINNNTDGDGGIIYMKSKPSSGITMTLTSGGTVGIGTDTNEPLGTGLHIFGQNHTITGGQFNNGVLIVEQNNGTKMFIDGNDIDVSGDTLSNSRLYLQDYSKAAVRVGGDFEITATTASQTAGVIYKNDEGTLKRFIYDFSYGFNGTITPTGENLFIGLNAGNFTMGSTATASFQSSYNVGIGGQSLDALTLGRRNTAIGFGAAGGITTGIENVAIGYTTMNALSTGSNNMALGTFALQGLTSGGANVGVGNLAGRYITDGSTPNQTGNNSIFIGYNTKALANGQSNQIVIGYQTTGNGANTATLGNSSITDTYLQGDVHLTDNIVTDQTALGTSNTTGDVVNFGGGTTAAGNLYYYNSSGNWIAADADFAASATTMLAIALGTSPTTNGMLLRGFARFTGNANYTAMTTVGAPLYVSTTAGGFTQTAPSGTGDIVRIIGYVVNTTNDVMYFNPDNVWVEIA